MKVLVANRGEIACRIIRGCKNLGLETVAVFSSADRGALHTKIADQAIFIGEGEASASYLHIESILNAIQVSGADAVHPGYGFLSENASFAIALKENGTQFLGPSAAVLEICGDKLKTKETAEKAGLPLIPDFSVEENLDQSAFKKFAESAGFPLIIKAGSGGGGRGMRVITQLKECKEALQAAKQEALSFFGDGSLFIEKYLQPVRHVEIQVVRDRAGNTYCLGERDCSLQRRHQKVIEEAPSPFVDHELRRKLYEFCERLCQELNYESLGTVEFLLDAKKQPFFIEVNPRIQVEHPVTEELFSIDLLELQIAIAQNQILPKLLGDKERFLHPEGHSIEARIYAEDPLSEFQPSAETIHQWKAPKGAGIRVESGIVSGGRVSRFYDPMVAKLIARADTRNDALDLLEKALRETTLLGPKHNIGFITTLLNLETFRSAQHSTGTIAESRVLDIDIPAYKESLLAELFGAPDHSEQKRGSPWEKEDFFRLRTQEGMTNIRQLLLDSEPYSVELPPESESRGKFILRRDQDPSSSDCSFVTSTLSSHRIDLLPVPRSKEKDLAPNQQILNALLPGVILRVAVTEDQEVEAGQTLAVLESMKIESPIQAPYAGTVRKIFCTSQDILERGDPIVLIEASH